MVHRLLPCSNSSLANLPSLQSLWTPNICDCGLDTLRPRDDYTFCITLHETMPAPRCSRLASKMLFLLFLNYYCSRIVVLEQLPGQSSASPPCSSPPLYHRPPRSMLCSIAIALLASSLVHCIAIVINTRKWLITIATLLLLASVPWRSMHENVNIVMVYPNIIIRAWFRSVKYGLEPKGVAGN